MNNFLEKWQKNPKYKTKIKLILYTLFVVVVSIYAFSINNYQKGDLDDIESSLGNYKDKEEIEIKKNIIDIPEEYNYKINVNIDDYEYKYTGTKNTNKTTIIKEENEIKTKYIYENNQYYVEESGKYIVTTKENVYNPINYNYLNLENINTYLNKAKKEENQYLVYLKDIILAHDSDDYFIITLNDNKINIDYTPLMKQFNDELKKYRVNIEIEEIE